MLNFPVCFSLNIYLNESLLRELSILLIGYKKTSMEGSMLVKVYQLENDS